MVARILVVEDDKNLLQVLKYNLIKEGYEIVTAENGEQALEVARTARPDIIVLDVMLPVMDGFEVCRIVRKEMTAPIIMLTARSDEIDRVVGLEIGADDYVTKPFSIRELLARVEAILRRAQTGEGKVAKSAIIKINDLEIDTAGRNARLAGSNLKLTPREFELLAFLAGNRGHVFTREHLLEKVWGYDNSGDTRTVDVHVRWLRRKIEADPANPKLLVTVRGFGYKMEG